MQYMTYDSSPLGTILLTADNVGLTGLYFGEKAELAEISVLPAKECELPIFDETKHWLDIYFSGREPDFTPAIHLTGTEFQMQVWEILRSIPYGETRSYGEIAKQIAKLRGIKRMSAQAVGSAVGHNPISVIVPCHRVIGSDGSLVGYGSGLDRKAALLTLERAGR